MASIDEHLARVASSARRQHTTTVGNPCTSRWWIRIVACFCLRGTIRSSRSIASIHPQAGSGTDARGDFLRPCNTALCDTVAR
jgi:hypothetical protein